MRKVIVGTVLQNKTISCPRIIVHMKIFFPILIVTLLSACAGSQQVKHFESKGNLISTKPLTCVAATSVSSSSSAADITAGAKACASAGNYKQAAKLVMVASAYAFYDTKRVADKSAHGALNALFAKEFGPLPEKERNSLMANIDALAKDTKTKAEICSFLITSQPPTYMPNYMIAHGMGAFTGGSQEPLVKNFDSKLSWAKAMKFVKCSR